MKPPPFRYFRPGDLDDALRLLDESGEDARPLAGGQSLVPAMNVRLARPSVLVDLGAIGVLRGIRSDEAGLSAGAMTRHSDFEFDDAVRERMPLLHCAMPGLAHMPIRNRGTIGGSLAHADPAGDWPALCMACDAVLHLRSRRSARTVPADGFSQGFFSTVLAAGELITEIRFPAWPAGRRWGAQKMTRRRGDFAMAGVVCVIDMRERVQAARIVVFGATDAPTLVHEAAAALTGQAPSAARIEEASKAAASTLRFRSDLHASAEYRKELVHALTRRALEQALPEARR